MDKIIRKKSFWIPAAAIVTVFSLSLILFVFDNSRYERRVLFFPDDMSRLIKGETRYLPVYDTEEQNINLLVKEQLLGPEYILYDNAVPEETRLNTLILNNDELYLDFSIDIISAGSESFLHFDDLIILIKKTVMFNFKHIHTVNVTVDGQVPYSFFYKGRSEN